MKVSEAKEKVCPFMSGWVNENHADRTIFKTAQCILDPCMFWVNTVKGKKEIARKKIPYDIYPSEEGRLRRQLEEDGYVQAGTSLELRSTYIKYEDAHEGYCAMKGEPGA